MLLDKINIFLANTTKGAENRKALFDTISGEVFEVLYNQKTPDYDFDAVLSEYMNQASFFANGLTDFKNLVFFLTQESSLENVELYAQLAKGILGTDPAKWLLVIEPHMDEISGEELHVLYRLGHG